MRIHDTLHVDDVLASEVLWHELGRRGDGHWQTDLHVPTLTTAVLTSVACPIHNAHPNK